MTDVSREDLEKKFNQLKGEIETAAGAARGTVTKVGVVAGVVLLILVFVLGSRRGKQGRTVVEVRRL